MLELLKTRKTFDETSEETFQDFLPLFNSLEKLTLPVATNFCQPMLLLKDLKISGFNAFQAINLDLLPNLETL